MKEKIINIIKFIFIAILFFKISGIFAYLFKLVGVDYRAFDYQDLAYFNALVEIFLAIIIYYLYHKTFKGDEQKIKDNKKFFINNVLKYFFIFLAIKIFSGIITIVLNAIFGYTSISSENQNLINDVTTMAPIIMLIGTSFFTPIVEEGLFRLGIRKILKNKYVFIVVSGVVFGLMHIFPTDLELTKALIDAVSYIMMGITLSYIYADTNNIWYTVIIHGLNNFISMLAIIFIT